MTEMIPPKVSVIVPVYNTEPWLRECLDSLIGQTLREIEIVCVNDGSSDGSPAVLREYAGRDRRIRIVDQENRGLSEARNAGVRAATGKYLTFLDSDDTLELSAAELCYAKMEQLGLEYLSFNCAAYGTDLNSAVIANEKTVFHKRDLDEAKVYSGQEMFALLKRSGGYNATATSCLIAREVFLAKGLWFHPSILHEDEPWTFTVLMTLSRCGYLNRILYRYRIHGGSIAQSEPTFAHAYGLFAGFRDVQDLLLRRPELLENGHYAEIETIHTAMMQQSAVWAYMSCGPDERKKRSGMTPVERLLFRHLMELPAELWDTVVQQKKQLQFLRESNDSLTRQLADSEREKRQWQSDASALRSSASFRVGQLMLFVPGKLKVLLKRSPALRKAVGKIRRLRQSAGAPAPAPAAGQASGKNRIDVLPSAAGGNTIVYRYRLAGEWADCFNADSTFEITYPFAVEDIPESIRIVPFLAQVLPVSWVCDAEVRVPSCDMDFFHCLEKVKAGYQAMYPMISFGGSLTAERLESVEVPRDRSPLVCFSGGVDALSTALSHLSEQPVLVSLWGSDVPAGDEAGWKPVEALMRKSAEQMGLRQITVRTSFRTLLSDRRLTERVQASGDNWWHGFHHGLGILGHMAPAAWRLGSSSVYIASSFTAGDRYTCASDPSIDNSVRFCGAKVVHDGYELNRQDKIRKIVGWSRENGVRLPLHVCWEKPGGENCCHCEKCWRTMLGLYAEGADPKEFGFPEYDGLSRLSPDLESRYADFRGGNISARYLPIQQRLRERFPADQVPPELSWLYRADFSKLKDGSLRLAGGKLVSPVWLIGVPDHNNMGDQFITDSERRFLRRQLPEKTVIEIPITELLRRNCSQISEIPPSQPVFLHGGGDLGTVWPEPEILRETVISRLPGNPIVILPQSIWFSEDEEGRAALERARQVYRGDHILICCRDRVSWAFAQASFDCRSVLVPDIVMWEARKPDNPPERFGAVTLLRSDKERKLTDAEAAEIDTVLAEKFHCLERSDMIQGPVLESAPDRKKRMDSLIRRLSAAECVVTDRLHGMILCALTGTPCVALGNGYHKVSSCYEWISDLGYIRFISGTNELREAVDAVCACKDREYPEKAMREKFKPLTDRILQFRTPS